MSLNLCDIVTITVPTLEVFQGLNEIAYMEKLLVWCRVHYKNVRKICLCYYCSLSFVCVCVYVHIYVRLLRHKMVLGRHIVLRT